MTEAVLADSQFSVARVVKPFPGFEAVYSGQLSSIPIAFPGTLDPDAGKAGFDPNLLEGIPVPLGSKILLFIPTIFNLSGLGNPNPVDYEYKFFWRLRNLRDFRESRKAYHFPRQSVGADDQFVIPASQHGIVFEGARDTDSAGGIGSFSSGTFAVESLRFTTLLGQSPLTPTGVAASYQQGLGELVGNKRVSFNPLWLDCAGDELLIEVTRPAIPLLENSEFWGFDDTTGPGDPNVDRGFSDLYGSGGVGGPFPDLGIYIFSGSNP